MQSATQLVRCPTLHVTCTPLTVAVRIVGARLQIGVQVQHVRHQAVGHRHAAAAAQVVGGQQVLQIGQRVRGHQLLGADVLRVAQRQHVAVEAGDLALERAGRQLLVAEVTVRAVYDDILLIEWEDAPTPE